MKNTNYSDRKIGEIVAGNFKAAGVFSRYGIDFCCGGGVKLEDVCQDKQIDLVKITGELVEALDQPSGIDYNLFSQRELIQHVIDVHHQYISNSITPLNAYLEKLCKVHGERYPELFEIRDEFLIASNELKKHMAKEEMVLFPYLMAMYGSIEKGYPLSLPHFGDIENPIRLMEEEHETEGSRFRKIAELSNNYQPPKGACQTYRVAYAMLQEFEEDLHTHIHLENNIIFPKAREAFKKFAEGKS